MNKNKRLAEILQRMEQAARARDWLDLALKLEGIHDVVSARWPSDGLHARDMCDAVDIISEMLKRSEATPSDLTALLDDLQALLR